MGRLNMLLPRLIRLRLLVLRLMMLWLTMLRLVLLRLMMLLFAGIELLLLAGCEWFAGHMRLIALPVAITVVIAVIGRRIAAVIARLRLEIRLRLAKLFLRRGDQTEIMLSVLIIVFSGNGISRTLRIAGKLEIFFGDMGRRSPNFHVRSVGLVHARQWILVMMTTFAVATPHALVLTVSHGCCSVNPSFAAARNAAGSTRSMALSITPRKSGKFPGAPLRGRWSSPTLNNAALTSGFAAVLRTPYSRDISPMRAPPMKLLGLNLGDPVCRPIRLSLFRLSFHLACAANLLRGR
jgi:hypothetical protein